MRQPGAALYKKNQFSAPGNAFGTACNKTCVVGYPSTCCDFCPVFTVVTDFRPRGPS